MSASNRTVRASNKNKSTSSTTAPAETSVLNQALAEKAKVGAPTPEQIRLAQIIDGSHNAPTIDKSLQEKIDQVMLITNKDSEEARMLLHEHGNDLTATVNAFFDGGASSQAWVETSKKKKTKSKVEAENKENSKHSSTDANRERSGSRPRGGGGGGRGGSTRGGRRDPGEQVPNSGRGGPSRRGRGLANGAVARGGRGGRSNRGGRGAASNVSDADGSTFQSSGGRQAFDETIDTWGGEAVETAALESFDDGTTNLDDWGDEEWTGSLDKTNVFHSSVEPTPPPASDLTAVDAAKLVNSSSVLQGNAGFQQQFEESQVGLSTGQQSYAGTTGQLTSSSAVLMPSSTSQPHNNTAVDLATLLQQAAPQSQLTGLGLSASAAAAAAAAAAANSSNGSLAVHLQQQQAAQQQGLSVSTSSIINNAVADALKASSRSSAVGSTSSAAYSQASTLPAHYQAQSHSTLFSSGLQSSAPRALSSSSSVSGSKSSGMLPVILPSATGQQVLRPKQARPRPQNTSKIPQTAVEMPEDAMSSINMQLTGLKFGSEGFDFIAEPNKNSSSHNESTSFVSTSYSSSYPVNVSSASSYGSAAVTSSVVVTAASYVNSTYHSSNYAGNSVAAGASSGSLSSSYSNAVPQSQPNYGTSSGGITTSLDRSDVKQNQLSPDAPPYSSSSEVVAGSTSSYMNIASSASAAAAAAAAAAAVGSSSAVQKKDMTSVGLSAGLNCSAGVKSSSLATPPGPLAGLSSSNSHYSYTLPKTSTAFPSPPSVSYSQTQNSYSGGAQDASSSYSSSTSSATSSNTASNSTPVSSAVSTSYSSSYPAQQQACAVQQQNVQQPQYHTPASVAPQNASIQYQNNYNTSSHAGLAAVSSKQLTPLKEPAQVSYSAESSASVATNQTSNNSTLSLQSVNPQQVQQQHAQQQHAQQQHKTSPSNVPPPGVHHQQPQSHLAQHPAAAAVAQQQILVQQQQFVNSNAAAIQPAAYFPSLQTSIYSIEELMQMQSRIAPPPHMVPSTLATSRDANSLNAAAYSSADVSKFRSDQNSSPVPSAISTQGGHGAFITNAGNATAVHPMYMYQNMAVPSSFPQYPPTIIQLPPNTGSSTSQFQGAPKLPYSASAAPPYYDSQTGGDFKGGYGSGTQGQTKQVAGNSASINSSMSDLSAGYKTHLTKPYDKSASFHTSTPPPFSLPGSNTPYGHAQVFLPAMPQAQHHSALIHHPLHQDNSAAGGQRGNAGQSKAGSKGYPNQFWSNT